MTKRESISPKKKENVFLGNKFLEYKNLSINRNKFAPISINNSINLTYQEKPISYNNFFPKNNFKQVGSIFRYKLQNNQFLNSYNEKLMPVFLTERKERKKSINKNEISAVPKTKKITKINLKSNPENAKIFMKKNLKNKYETIGNVGEKRINQNELAFQHKFIPSKFNTPNKKKKIRISISTNQLNKKLFTKK